MSKNKLQKVTSNDEKKSKNEINEINEKDANVSNDATQKKLDPTRYGDWEVNGIAVDF
tara:strand:+ start:361 stop:534 length:174 start_codon:yes stop_codon:yes gene_type:complete